MKIQNSGSINNNVTQKTKRSNPNGAFGLLLDADRQEAQQQIAPRHPPQDQSDNTASAPMQEAWHTLEESVSLLDKAMHSLETGDSPPQQLIQEIEQLRGLLRQQVTSGSAALELRQADTLLAVEAERIRSMQS